MDQFEIVERVEMGQMASMFFNKGKVLYDAGNVAKGFPVHRCCHLKGNILLGEGSPLIPLIVIKCYAIATTLSRERRTFLRREDDVASLAVLSHSHCEILSSLMGCNFRLINPPVVRNDLVESPSRQPLHLHNGMYVRTRTCNCVDICCL